MRTEEQKILQEPVVVKLGGKDYEIKPLPIILASPWRKKFIKLLQDVSALAKITDEDAGFADALNNVLIEKPDELTDLFFEYARLSKEELQNSASSVEILNALIEVIAFESPFLGAAARITTAVRKNLV